MGRTEWEKEREGECFAFFFGLAGLYLFVNCDFVLMSFFVGVFMYFV